MIKHLNAALWSSSNRLMSQYWTCAVQSETMKCSANYSFTPLHHHVRSRSVICKRKNKKKIQSRWNWSSVTETCIPKSLGELLFLVIIFLATIFIIMSDAYDWILSHWNFYFRDKFQVDISSIGTIVALLPCVIIGSSPACIAKP